MTSLVAHMNQEESHYAPKQTYFNPYEQNGGWVIVLWFSYLAEMAVIVKCLKKGGCVQ